MNNHFGNLQKIHNNKKTYGITPDIPGGFITTDALENLAKVAKKYNGVIKITSGQRILITNLQEKDLQSVWEELKMKPAVIETNSIKNVEMCPAGFCKRSKFNTISTGMKLYNKYIKLPMPCRTKIGVAGCRNACGSVYSKDIGIIADKTGFLISVGGSSGYNPRQSDIIIKDVSESYALYIIDNILKYYSTNALSGEKIGHFIDRIGLNVFKQNIL